jgi:hypothetical protein
LSFRVRIKRMSTRSGRRGWLVLIPRRSEKI